MRARDICGLFISSAGTGDEQSDANKKGTFQRLPSFCPPARTSSDPRVKCIEFRGICKGRILWCRVPAAPHQGGRGTTKNDSARSQLAELKRGS